MVQLNAVPLTFVNVLPLSGGSGGDTQETASAYPRCAVKLISRVCRFIENNVSGFRLIRCECPGDLTNRDIGLPVAHEPVGLDPMI